MFQFKASTKLTSSVSVLDEIEDMEIIDNFSEIDLQVYDWDF